MCFGRFCKNLCGKSVAYIYLKTVDSEVDVFLVVTKGGVGVHAYSVGDRSGVG